MSTLVSASSHIIFQDPVLGRIAVPAQVPAGFAVFYTTSDFDGYLNEETVPLIEGLLREHFRINASLRTCHQVHGTAVVEAAAGEGRGGGYADCDTCDALWSRERGIALGIKVADCLPISLIDPIGCVTANLHVGWRGAAKGIVAETLQALGSASRFSPAAAVAFLGPSIRQCCFEVGPEVVEEFRKVLQGVDAYVRPGRGDRSYLDLVSITAEALSRGGLSRAAIHDSGLCTRCRGSVFHSYRRNRTTGRNLAIVGQ